MNFIERLQTLTASDWLLVLSIMPALWFFVEYVLLTKWWVDPLGWVTALYNVSVNGLLGLIVYAIFMGERVPEVWRFLFAGFLFTALWGKAIILHNERRKGHLPERAHTSHKEISMTNPTPNAVTPPDIWYKAQRALRTGVQGLIAALTVWAAFNLIWPDIAAQLATILPASWVAWLARAVTSIGAVALALSRIMAIPSVNAFLTKWLNLGAVPKRALVEAKTVEDGKVFDITVVKPDPKAILPGDAPRGT